MRIPGVITALIVVAVACSPDLVDTERADVAIGPTPTVDVPEPVDTAGEPQESSAPATSAVPDTSEVADAPDVSETDPPPDELRDPSLGVGDELFPDLGSSDVDVVSYHVELDIDPGAETVDGSVDVVARVASDIESVPLDQVGLDVTETRVDGLVVEFETTETELLVDVPDDARDSSDPASPEASEIELFITVDYSFRPDLATSDFVLPTGWFANPDTGESYVLNQPDGARLWMPSNDHPSDKATWTFDVTVPDGFVAVANGELAGRPSGGLERPWSWREDEPMSTYLAQLIVGDYEIVVPDPLVSGDDDEIGLTYVVPAGERERFSEAFASVGEQIAFFEERFGPYPLSRYGLAFVADLTSVAMETQGRSMFGTSDFPTETLGYLQHLLLAHELVHQWFGNAVSPADWSDIWLNESITTYGQWLWLDEIGLQPIDSHAAAVLEQRQAPLGSTGDPERDEMFSFVVYDGGAAVVHALRLTVGDDAFFEILQRWIAEHLGTSQSTESFIDLAEEVHGGDLTDFFDDWLFADVLPPEYP